MALGPNSAVGSGSLLLIIEQEVDYAIKAIAKSATSASLEEGR